uniref:CUB domain-containing protein n=1 Tax=Macrostomum lignano TaxID=282301 RepID=A0A1I8JLF6_9PLAT
HRSPKKFLCSNQQMDLLLLLLTAFLGSLLAFETGSAVAVPADTGTIQCPENFGQPGAVYENSKVYNWTIRGPKAVAIRFHFAELETPYDRLEIFEGTDDLEVSYRRNPKFRINPNNATSQALVLIAPVLIRFKTDSSVAKRGFNLTYTLEESLVRFRTFTEPSDDAICSELEVSDRDTSNVSIEYRWLIDRPGRIDLKLSFSDLARIYQMTTTPDKEPVFIDGPKEREGTSRFRLFGPVLVQVKKTQTRGRVFRLSYRSSDGDLEMPTEIIKNEEGKRICYQSKGADIAVSNVTTRAWSIAVNPQQIVELELFDAEGSQPHTDTIGVYNGVRPVLSESPIFSQTGLLGERKTVRANGFVTVVLTTEARRSRRGLGLSYTVYSTPQAEPSGQIGFPKGSAEFNSDIDYRWFISRDIRLSIRFASISLRPNGKLYIYENTTSEDEAALRFLVTNASSRESEFRLSGPVMIRLVASGDGQSRDFRLSYAADQSGNTDMAVELIDGYRGSRALIPENGSPTAWVIAAKPGRSVLLYLPELPVESGIAISLYEGAVTSLSNSEPLQRIPYASIVRYNGPLTVVYRPRASSFIRSQREFKFQLMNAQEPLVKDSGSIRCPQVSGETLESEMEYRWTINRLNLVVIEVSTVDIGSGVIELYEEAYLTDEPQQAKLKFVLTQSNATAREAYRLPGPVMVRFVPGKDFVGQGFNLSYTTKERTLHRIFNYDSGNIFCPETALVNYEKFMDYRWTINRKSIIVIRFDFIDIQDTIEFYEKVDESGEPDRRRWKLNVTQEAAEASNITLVGPVLIRFRTNSQVTAPGFQLYYQAGSKILDSGNLSYPENYGYSKYDNNVDYEWSIYEQKTVVLTFIRYDTESNYDWIGLYENSPVHEKPDENKRKYRLTGSGYGETYTLKGPVLIRFKTDGSGNRDGFRMTYYLEETSSLSGDSGEVRWVNPPSFTKAQVNYIWKIDRKAAVAVKFSGVEISDCCDKIQLWRKDSSAANITLTKGNATSSTYRLIGPGMIKLVTAGRPMQRALNFSYEIGDQFVISSVLTQTQGEIGVQSSNLRNAIGLDVCDTDGYDMEIDRRWVVDTTAAVSIRFVQAQLLSGCDKLELHERTKIPTPRSRVFSLTDAPLSDLMSTEFKLRGPAVVRLQSRRMRPTIVPFGATFSVNRQNLSMTTALLRNLDGLQGCLMPDGRSSCGPSSARAWSIAVSPQQTVELQLFDAEGGQPHGDTVSVYTGVEPRLSESPIFSQTGLLGERKTLRASGFVTVVLRTDANEAKRGFGLQYSVKNVLLSGRSGEIRFPQNSSDSSAFDLDMDYSWIIQSSGSVRINVRSLNLQDGDKLHLYENTTSKDELKRRFVLADASASESEFWLRGSVLIRITAAGDGSPRSFRLAYQSDPDLKLENAVEVVKSSRGTRWSFPKFDTTDRTERAKIVWVIAPKPSHEFTVHILFKEEEFFEFYDSYTCGWFVYAGNWLTQRLSNDSFEAQFSGLTQHVSKSGPVSVYWEQIEESSIIDRCTDLVFQFDYQIRNVHRYLSEDSGSLRCPEESSSTYANEMEYRWTINRRNFVLITVTSADIGYGNDIIQLYEMTDRETDEPEESKLRFTLTQANATSATYKLIGPVLIRFSTDESLVGKGFSLSYTVEERTLSRNLLNDSGSIRCPNEEYEAYEHQMDYRWYIPSSRVVFLTVRSMGIQDANDVLEFYEKTDSSAEPQPENRKYTLTGDSWSSIKYVLVGPALIRFKTDHQNASRGFIIDYYLDRYVVDSGKLQCPENFGSGYYLNNKTYAWWIGDLSLLEMKVDSYDVETGIDKISFYEKTQLFEDAQDSKKGFTVTSDNKTAHVVGPVLIQFVTDISIIGAGFNLSYSALDSRNEKADVVCSEGEQLPAEEEMKYDLETDYRWLIDRQGWVSLKLSHADIVRLYEMTADPSEDRLAFVSEHRSMTNATSVEFRLRGPVLVQVTTKRVSGNIFKLSYQSGSEELPTPTELIKNIEGSKAIYPSRGPVGSSRAWSIAVSPQQTVELQLFDAEGGQPHGDTVSVYTGVEPRLSESPIFSQTGLLGERKTLRASGFVTVVLRTGASGDRFGLRFTYSVGNVSLSDAEGEISYSSQSEATDGNLDHRWIIDRSGTVRIRFSSINLPAGDKVYLYQNTRSETEDNLKFVVSDSSASQSEFRLSGPVLLRFTANSDGSRRDFKLTYTADGSAEEASPATEVIRGSRGMRLCNPAEGSTVLPRPSSTKWIVAPTGSHDFLTHLIFNRITTSSSVEIFAGDMDLLSSPAMQKSARRIPFANHVTHKGILAVVYSSNNSASASGQVVFDYQIRSVHVAMTNDSASFSCPEETGSTYANEMEYRWTINRRNFVLITVTSADIGYGNDIIQLYEMTDGETDEPEESKLRFTLTQANATSATYKLIGPVLIRFSTDKRLVGQGFDLSYSIEPRTVFANQSQSFAMLQYPTDANRTMEKWMEYKWLIPGKYVYKLAFNWSNLGADGSFIEVFAISDQASADADEQNLLFILTDANATSADFVLTGPLLIRVKTGRRFDGRGIAFSYRRGPVVVSEDLGTIKCPSNYGSSMYAKYANNKDYQWLIDATGPVNIRMEEVDIENCCDKIFIYDRFSISDEVDDSKLTTSLVNSNATGVSLSLQGPVLLRFKTDSSVTSKGFRLVYSTQSLNVTNTTGWI